MAPFLCRETPGAKKALSISICYMDLVKRQKERYPQKKWKAYNLRNSHKDSETLKERLISTLLELMHCDNGLIARLFRVV